ncbi:hypothetical protein ACSF6T_12975 [Escherichia coli]|uniref:hypothetical protein n=1 Tax=Escherichia coli TaxID=562 RepID=UPI003EEAAD62
MKIITRGEASGIITVSIRCIPSLSVLATQDTLPRGTAVLKRIPVVRCAVDTSRCAGGLQNAVRTVLVGHGRLMSVTLN